MIHSLITHTEAHFQHKSVSEKGGFNLAINGVGIWKDDSDPAVKAMHDSRSINDLLENFFAYSENKNELYDGDSKSFDIMMLLTGADKEVSNMDMSPISEQGLAFVSLVCSKGPVGVPKMVIQDNGSHRDNTPSLLAHEMGHLMGSGHDGTQGEDRKNSEYYGKLIDCPQDEHLMTPVISPGIKEWSSC